MKTREELNDLAEKANYEKNICNIARIEKDPTIKKYIEAIELAAERGDYTIRFSIPNMRVYYDLSILFDYYNITLGIYSSNLCDITEANVYRVLFIASWK